MFLEIGSELKCIIIFGFCGKVVIFRNRLLCVIIILLFCLCVIMFVKGFVSNGYCKVLVNWINNVVFFFVWLLLIIKMLFFWYYWFVNCCICFVERIDWLVNKVVCWEFFVFFFKLGNNGFCKGKFKWIGVVGVCCVNVVFLVFC